MTASPAKPPFDRVPREHLEKWVVDSCNHPIRMPVSEMTIYGYAQHTPGQRNYDVFGELIRLAGHNTNVRVASFDEARDWWGRLDYGDLTYELWLDYITDIVATTKASRWHQACREWFGIDPENIHDQL